MYYQMNVATDVYRDTVKRAEAKAARNWRFREIKTPEAKFLTAALTSVLGLFIR
jgi:hypothetical protein